MLEFPNVKYTAILIIMVWYVGIQRQGWRSQTEDGPNENGQTAAIREGKSKEKGGGGRRGGRRGGRKRRRRRRRGGKEEEEEVRGGRGGGGERRKEEAVTKMEGEKDEAVNNQHSFSCRPSTYHPWRSQGSFQ